jgi:hypothetical protein
MKIIHLLAVYRAWGAQIPSARSLWRLNFVRWRLIFVGLLYGICCIYLRTAALCCVCLCMCSCTIESSHQSINQQNVSTILGFFTWYVYAMQVLNLYYRLSCPAFWTQDRNITVDTVRNLLWSTILMKFPLEIQPKTWQFLHLVPDWMLKADGSFRGFSYLHAKWQEGPFPHPWPHRPL